MRKLRIILQMIRFEHTLFALPFAYMGAALAVDGVPELSRILWITLAMVGARSAAMGWNRLADLKFDAENPRTAGRALPAGLLKTSEVVLFVIVSVFLLVFSAAQLNYLCLVLSPFAAFFLIFYSYTKRFTWLCHFVLGFTLGIAPVGGWIGITGSFDWPPAVLSLAVTLWVAGFDILYQMNDREFDIAHGLHTIPARFGPRVSLNLAMILLAVTFVLLAFLGGGLDLGTWYWVGLAAVGAIFLAEGMLVASKDMARIQKAFDLNLSVSLTLFAFTMLDLLL